MAKNDKRADSGIKASKRNKAIVIAIVALFAVIIIGWFIYISGLLNKVLTGVKIVRTVDGVTQTLDNISVAETNYHYYQVLSSYYNYGIINGEMDLDAVYDQTTGQTYRQMLLDHFPAPFAARAVRVQRKQIPDDIAIYFHVLSNLSCSLILARW